MLSRRQLLAIASGAGLASIIVGCSTSKSAPTAGPTSTAAGTTAVPSTPTVVATPATVTVTESLEPAVSGVMLCREAWGARPALPGGRPQVPIRMTLHHSAVALPDNREIIARLQQHQRYHQDSKGWVDIAYHVAVDRDGNIFQLRDPLIAGDTATDYDTTGHFLVLAEGNFDEEIPSEPQMNSTALVFAWATKQFGITADTLASHKEVTSGTSCPGHNLEAHMLSGDMKRRVEETLLNGFELQQLCGPEADARVAAIKAGS